MKCSPATAETASMLMTSACLCRGRQLFSDYLRGMEMEQVKGLWRSLLQPGLLGVAIRCAVGGVDAVFGRVLLRLSAVQDAHVLPLLLASPAGRRAHRLGHRTVGRGMERAWVWCLRPGGGRRRRSPLRLIPLIMGRHLAPTHLLGGSAGREGVAVQIGAAVGHGVGRRTGRDGKVFLIAGMAAGFSGSSRTPHRRRFFALEVMTAGALEYAALFPAMTASFRRLRRVGSAGAGEISGGGLRPCRAECGRGGRPSGGGGPLRCHGRALCTGAGGGEGLGCKGAAQFPGADRGWAGRSPAADAVRPRTLRGPGHQSHRPGHGRRDHLLV